MCGDPGSGQAVSQSGGGRRTGEKAAWTLGWLGGFLWVLILSVVRLVQGSVASGMAGIALFAAAVSMIVVFAPWRHATVRQWKLMVPVYVTLFGSIVWAISTMGAGELGLGWGSAFLVLPCLIPLWTAGTKRWNDVNGPPGGS